MAKILSIEVEASQVRVAEIEVRGKKGRIFNCFCIPAPQGAVEDGQIRDTKSLAEVLREELSQRKIKTKKGIFCNWFYQNCQQRSSDSVCKDKQDSEHH